MARPSQNRWLELWQRLGGQGKAVSVYGDLARHYDEPHRSYHNFDHIQHCLQEFDSARYLARNPDAVELAIWFHDAIYDTHARDNEERSAELAVSVLKSAGMSQSLVRPVSSLVIATKHNALPDDSDESLLVDVDLSILGQPWEKFEEYEHQIREEYDWVDAISFVEGRSKILKMFLNRPRIYATAFFRGKYEDQARENIARSIDQLKAGTIQDS
jgi:predicted metal-dependent HD superfamily phosphohydrolase